VEFIEIEKEIEYLKKFVEIQQLRRSGRCKISFDISEDVIDFKIAPLLLIPLVENAFKYLTNRKDTDNFVYISLTKTGSQMCFIIENTTAESAIEKKEHGGIGLTNLKSRLSLIYPKKHELLINKENNIFKVKLTLNVG
jgi:LytS/YehU family sensor histidine kinase